MVGGVMTGGYTRQGWNGVGSGVPLQTTPVPSQERHFSVSFVFVVSTNGPAE